MYIHPFEDLWWCVPLHISFFLQPGHGTLGLDQADNEHSTAYTKGLAKTGSDHKSTSNWVLKELTADTWFSSWGPVEQTPENNLWLWVSLLTSRIVNSPRVLQALLHGNGLHNRIFTRRLFSYWDAMDCNATTLRCLCDMGLCSAAILCLMSSVFLFWGAKACISCLLPDEMS